MEELERRGFEVTYLKPEKSGAVSVEAEEKALRADTILVSLMLVNNETGAITDMSAISAMLRRNKSIALLHTDAVQAFMKLAFSPKSLGADMISISGHKLHAPKGIGALYISDSVKLKPYIHGGAQESGRRAGTEAMPQILAFGEACRVAKEGFKANSLHIAELRRLALEKLSENIPELQLIPGGAEHILSISMPGWRSEVLMNFLEAKGVYVSRSSACKKGGRSHVLEAIGLDAKVIDGAIRIGFCRYNTEEDVNALCDGLIEARNTLAHR
jgi:cysteine desulfurase